MKKLLSLSLAVILTNAASLAFADDSTVTIWVTKASDTTAKVCTSDSKCNATVPITFASDASWDSVKDSYTVSADTAAALSAKKECIAIGSDGTATFSKSASTKK